MDRCFVITAQAEATVHGRVDGQWALRPVLAAVLTVIYIEHGLSIVIIAWMVSGPCTHFHNSRADIMLLRSLCCYCCCLPVHQAIFIIVYLSSSAFVFWLIPMKEHLGGSQTPKDYQQSFYFAFITFSTVGLGDFSIEVAGKAATTALLLGTMFAGVAVFAAFIAVVNNTLQKLVVKADYLIVITNEDDTGEDDDLVYVVMLYLHCTALQCTALHCTALHCTVLVYVVMLCGIFCNRCIDVVSRARIARHLPSHHERPVTPLSRLFVRACVCVRAALLT